MDSPLTVYVKNDADIRFVRDEVFLEIPRICAVFLYHSPDAYRFVVTSGCDGKHGKDSLHYIHCAIDCRIWFIKNGKQVRLTKQTQTLIKKDLDKALGPDFDIVIEPSHIHIEWDPT